MTISEAITLVCEYVITCEAGMHYPGLSVSPAEEAACLLLKHREEICKLYADVDKIRQALSHRDST